MNRHVPGGGTKGVPGIPASTACLEGHRAQKAPFGVETVKINSTSSLDGNVRTVAVYI